ncbi:MAG: hypothetical protein ACRDWX_02890 [Acidimicrobiia bacterium]
MLILLGGVATILTVRKSLTTSLDPEGLAGVVRAVLTALTVVVGTMYLIRSRSSRSFPRSTSATTP